MKKTLIALAAVAVSSAAMAQVTVSGVLDVQAVNNSKSTTIADTKAAADAVRTNTAAPGNNGWSTSQVAITVVEDLGNGLKATANINTGLNGGLSAFADRDRSLSLSGGFGTVRIGRFSPAADGSGNFYAATSNTAGSGDGLTSANHGRRVAMQYTTPNMGGLTGAVTYASGKVDKQAEAGKTGSGYMGLNLSYAQGPLSLAAGTSTVTTNVEAVAAVTSVCINSAATTTPAITASAAGTCAAGTTKLAGSEAVAAKETKDKQMYVGASYDLGVATVVANYKTGKISSAGVNSADVRVTTFGVTVPMGAVTLAANMYTGKDAVAAAVTDDGYKLKGNQISARYALSKRTFAYVAQGRAERTREAANTTKGASSVLKQTTAGLVHSF